MVYALTIDSSNFAPAQFTSLAMILNVIIPNIILVAGVLLFLMLIYMGFQYMSSDGNPDKLKKVKATLNMSLIGFGIILASYLLVKLIASLLGIGGPNSPF